jgi:signal transduction histidine kinase
VNFSGPLSQEVPGSLASHVLLIIFTGLIVAAVASLWLFDSERTRAVERFAAADAATRIIEYARLPAEFTTAPSRSAPRARVRWQEMQAVGDPPPGATPPSGTFSSELRRVLAQNLGEDPVVWMSTREDRRTVPAPAPVAGRAAPLPQEGLSRYVTVALKFRDGRQALAETTIFQPALQIPTEAWLSIALLFVVTAIFSIWAVYLAVQPVRMLAGAADRISRNIDEPPLAEDKGASEIRSAARSFNRMQDRLKRHVNSRALAFAAMSHDLRTPLTRMRLRLESLGDDAKHKLGDDLDEIEALATSVLDVTRSLAADEPMARIDLAELSHKLVDDYAQLGHSLKVEGEAAPIEARPLSLRRALVNVMDNAFKYARDVVLRIDEGKGEVLLHVLDRGPGIPSEEQEKVLYPFYRIEGSRSRETGGAGLGLAIAKDIVEGHGGALEVANRPDGGLRVSFRMPR